MNVWGVVSRGEVCMYRHCYNVVCYLEYECSPAFWAGHCAVHGYSPVVVLCSVLK